MAVKRRIPSYHTANPLSCAIKRWREFSSCNAAKMAGWEKIVNLHLIFADGRKRSTDLSGAFYAVALRALTSSSTQQLPSFPILKSSRWRVLDDEGREKTWKSFRIEHFIIIHPINDSETRSEQTEASVYSHVNWCVCSRSIFSILTRIMFAGCLSLQFISPRSDNKTFYSRFASIAPPACK